MKKIVKLSAAILMSAIVFAGCSKKEGTKATGKTEDITLTVWGPQEDQVDENSFLQQATKKFAEKHPEWNITWKFGVCSEGDAGNTVSQDPSAAADVYMFANDQIGTLIQANAIAKLGGATLKQVQDDNSATMIASVSYNGGVYGVPFTGNTWFMYYDKSVFSEDDVKSLDKMLAKGKVAFPVTNTWYLPAFYFAMGGTMFGDGSDGSKGITFGSDDCAKATSYIAKAIKSGKLIDDANGVGLDGFRNGTIGAMFSGTWDAANVAGALGDNYAATKLPTFNVDGKERQLYSFAGSKAYGVNPNSKAMAAAYALAAWLGSSEMQDLHYNIRKGAVIPCNAKLLENPAYGKDPAAVAQGLTIDNTAKIQPSIPEMGTYWANAGSMGSALANGEVTEANAADLTKKWNEGINNAGL